MVKEPTELEIAQKEAEEAAKRTNDKIKEMGEYASTLDITLNKIQSLFDRIRNAPSEDKTRYKKLKAVRLNWEQQVKEIQKEYKTRMDMAGDTGKAGVAAGVAVAALGPTAAMGVATTFGVASTGTAISALSGAAATNAALAWLGGGTIAAGGGGMAAGSAFLALAGPVGWGIAIVSILSSAALFFWSKKNKERLENIYTLISRRDVETYRLAFLEICKRIESIKKENDNLERAIEKIKNIGTDYKKMTENQQYKLGLYFNLMDAATMLLVNPILGLQPKYTEEDFKKLCAFKTGDASEFYKNHKVMVIAMANLLYKIELDEDDKKVLVKSFNKNKDFLKSVNMDNEKFKDFHITFVEEALSYRYECRIY